MHSGTGSATRYGNRDGGRAPPLQATWGALKLVRRAKKTLEL